MFFLEFYPLHFIEIASYTYERRFLGDSRGENETKLHALLIWGDPQR